MSYEIKIKLIKFLLKYFPFLAKYRRNASKIKSSIFSNLGKNNRLIILDDDDNEIQTDYIPNLNITFMGDNSTVKIYASSVFPIRYEIRMYSNCEFFVGKKCSISIIDTNYFATGAKVHIGDDVHLNGTALRLTSEYNLNIKIGSHTHCASGSVICATDDHTIFDNETKEALNEAQPTEIGEHCWIGLRSIILKGVNLPTGTVVAAGSVCSRSINKEILKYKQNVIVAGNPAKVIRENIGWDFLPPQRYEENKYAK